MPKTEFTPDELKQFFTKRDGNNAKQYHYCKDARKLEADMRVHSDGTFPACLIEERRPNEPLTVKDYRKKIFVPKTKPYFTKIESTLQKIRRSSDWSIKYPDTSFDKIREEEKMIDYAEDNYPTFRSITNWAFSLLLRNILIDPNAVVLISPINIPQEQNVFLEPVATIFNSCDVIWFEDGDYAVLRNKVGCKYMGNKDGDSYYIITTVDIKRYDQINHRQQFEVMWEYAHNLPELPAFKLPGVVIDVYGNYSLHESRIAGILPEFNEALREYSDLQAAKVLHLYPERWEYTQNECVKCKGTGQRMDQTQTPACQVTCETCHGAGYIATGPYAKMLIRPASADQLQLPTPPAGFVEKDVKIIELQDQGVADHIRNGLASINFEFLAQTPLNQSGTAKEVDKDELNNTVHSIAEDIVKVLDKVYWLIALYRYSTQYTPDEIYDMLPMIAVPEKYDILNTAYFDEQITSAIKNKLNPAIINAMEVAYATKAFNNDLHVAEFVGLVLKLNPLAGISEDDKMSRLSNGGITKLDYIVSSNINKFVNDAVETTKGFMELDVQKQKDDVYAMAKAQATEEVAALIPADGDMGGVIDGSEIGKVPLALQQLALAKQRSIADGDTVLANLIEGKMKELIDNL